MKYLLLLLIFSTNAFGVDIQHPNGVRIRADSTESNLSTGVTIYNGGVIVTRDGIELRADRVTEYRKGKTLFKIIAEGLPVKYTDENAKLSEVIYGIAKYFEYNVISGKVLLTDFEFTDVNGNTSKSRSGIYVF